MWRYFRLKVKKKTGFSRSWDSHRPSLYNGSSMRTLIILFDPTIDEWAVWMKGKLKQISPWNLFVEMRIFFSSLSPIWGELSWEEHFILTCRMHSRAGSPFVKWTQDARGNWAKHRAGRSLSAAASWSSFRNNSKSFFRFQFPQKNHFIFLQLLCPWVKCTQLKKSDLFRILWSPLEAAFSSYLSV